MCGIAGIVPLDGKSTPDRARLSRMIHALRHRGPDGFGFHETPGIGLAHARLSIIDLSTGDQPIRNETGTIWVVFNGEIFNYVELRADLERAGHRFYTHSDTEVLVHAYEEHGLDFVHQLNGQFAIALWDAPRRRLVLARDRTGIRPLLYARTREALLFASEAKSLFASGEVFARLDPVGIAQVCTFWSCIAPRTAFEGVNALPPGHLAVFEDGRLDVRRYWDWQFPDGEPAVTRDPIEAAEELRALFVDAVRLQLRSDVPVGAYLSGGLDSSAVSAAIRSFTPNRLTTFSIAFESREFDEREHQLEMARHLGTDHVMRTVTAREIGEAFPRAIQHIETPIVRTAGVPLMLLADRVRDSGFKVVLTGEGADEVFAGYDLFKEAKIRRFWARQPQSTWRPLLLRRLYGYLSNSPTSRGTMAGRFFATGLEDVDDPFYAHRLRWATTGRILRLMTPEFRGAIEEACAGTPLEALVPRPDSAWAPLNRDQYVEAHTLLAGYLLHAQGDRVAMAASIEGRYPFLDHRLIEFASRLPTRWKIRGLTEKYLLRKAVAGWLPPTVGQRTKQPYRAPDADSFFTNGLPLPYVQEALSAPALRDAGCFDPVAVGRLVEKCRSGAAIGFGDNMALVAALSIQLLQQQFVGAAAGSTGSAPAVARRT
jgi:asparagine synthase (glutamine-hydrolysing)